MSYVLLIVEPSSQRAERGRAAGEAAYASMQRFAAGLEARGVLRAVESLTSTSDAVRVERREDRRSLIDGPFAEAKEMVGGFFLLDGVSREEAIEIAAECPAAAWAAVEVREVGPCWK